MTIANETEFTQSLKALTLLRQGLGALRREVTNETNYRVMAEGPLDEIERIEGEINAYLGLDDVRAQLWLRVAGEGIEATNAPSGVMTAILNGFRRALQAATQHLLSGQVASRPTARVQQAVDVRLAAMAPGSLRLGLNIEAAVEDPEAAQCARRSLEEYLTVAAWAGSAADDAELARIIPDEARRRLLLNLVMELAPRTRGQVESVGFTGRLVKQRGAIQLTRESRAHLAAAIDSVDKQIPEHCLGRLRELDLDKLTGVVRNADGQVNCEFAEELMTVAQGALGRRVSVVGTRARQRTLFVTRLEILDDVDADLDP